MCPLRLILSASVAAAQIAAAAAADLTLIIENVPNDEGVIGVIVCSEEKYLNETCEHVAGEPAKTGEMKVVFEGVAPGQWGALVQHDENENGKLDFKWWGPPAEAYGASRNPPPRMGPPRWRDVVFTMGEEDKTITITLKGGGA